jgi:hypothetical protein
MQQVLQHYKMKPLHCLPCFCQLEKLPPNQHAPDLTGTRPNLIQLGISQQPPSRVVIDIAITPKHLGAKQGADKETHMEVNRTLVLSPSTNKETHI